MKQSEGKPILKVLILEDQEEDYHMLVWQLRRGDREIEGVRVANEAQYREALAKGGFDLILSDYYLPSFDAVRALEIYKEAGLDIPFVVVTGVAGEEAAVKITKAGAHDYLLKGNLTRLNVVVERELRESKSRMNFQRLHEQAGVQQKALLNLGERLNLAMEFARVVTWTWQADEDTITWSGPVEGIFGLSAGALTSYRQLSAIIHPDHRDALHQQLAKAKVDGGKYSAEFRIVKSDGTIRWVAGAGGAVIGAGGEVSELAGVYFDISDRKRAEQAQAESKARLEMEIAQRTSAVKELQKTEEQLRRSLRDKDTLLREVHHRVKNNLQVVSSLLRMQGRLLRDQQARDALMESQRRVLCMALIHKHIYAGQSFGRIDFLEYARTLIDELVRSYAGRNGKVRCRLDIAPVLLEIEQAIPCGLILNELVTNALKYAYPNGQNGEVIVRLEEASPGRVRLTVTDDGIGLPAGFELQNSNSMGLLLVEDLAKQVEGKFAFRSHPGTTFSVEFPKELSAVVGA